MTLRESTTPLYKLRLISKSEHHRPGAVFLRAETLTFCILLRQNDSLTAWSMMHDGIWHIYLLCRIWCCAKGFGDCKAILQPRFPGSPEALAQQSQALALPWSESRSKFAVKIDWCKLSLSCEKVFSHFWKYLFDYSFLFHTAFRCISY